MITPHPNLRVEKSIFVKTLQEKKELKSVQSEFKRNGLQEWNERNRPGNNHFIMVL